MKLFTWIIIAGILLASFFLKINIQNNQLGLALMLLLLALYSELKEFNFWGIWGKKKEEELKALEGQQATGDKEIQVNKTKLDQAERTSPQIELMERTQSNFLALAFEVERLLRIYATIGLGKTIQNNINVTTLTKELRKKELLTESGVKQLQAIRWLRDIIIHGRQNEINQTTLNVGIEIAYSLYSELYRQVYGEDPKIN